MAILEFRSSDSALIFWTTTYFKDINDKTFSDLPIRHDITLMYIFLKIASILLWHGMHYLVLFAYIKSSMFYSTSLVYVVFHTLISPTRFISTWKLTWDLLVSSETDIFQSDGSLNASACNFSPKVVICLTLLIIFHLWFLNHLKVMAGGILRLLCLAC